MAEKNFTCKEIAEILGVSDKSVRRYLNSYFFINNGTYQVSEKMLEVLKTQHLGQATDSDVRDFERVEYFTEDEYQEFHKRLSEYPHLKEQIQYILKDLEYHKKSIESHNRQMEMLLLSIAQKRFIDAGKENSTLPFEESPFK